MLACEGDEFLSDKRKEITEQDALSMSSPEGKKGNYTGPKYGGWMRDECAELIAS